MQSNNYTHHLILIICALLVFIRLGWSEVQPWDEGLYAMRALAVVNYGEFWDQSAHSPGGLYSASYPPFAVWMQAASIAILGKTALAVRLFSALCSVVSIILIYVISRRILSEKYSIYSAILIAGTVVWNNISRQGMFDVPVVAFSLLSFYIMLKINETEHLKSQILASVLLFLSLTFVFLTKVITTFIPVLLFIPLFLTSKNKIAKKIISISMLMAILASLSWFASMYLSHGWDFVRYAAVPQFYSVWESNAKQLGIFFYFNQLVVANPAFIYAFILLVLFIARYKFNSSLFKISNQEHETDNKHRISSNNYIFIAFLLWFVIAFIFLSAGQTKHIHYTVYLVPPGIILSLFLYQKMPEIIKSPFIRLYLISLFYISFLWSLSQDLRTNLKKILTDAEPALPTFIFLLISALLLILPFLIRKKKHERVFQYLCYSSLVVISTFLILKAGNINLSQPGGYAHGVLLPVGILKQFGSNSYLYLYHETTKADRLNPQIAWYTDGWHIGWLKGKTHIDIAMPQKSVDYSQLSKAEEYPDELIIYSYGGEINDVVKLIINELGRSRRILCHTHSYIVFGVMRDVKKNPIYASKIDD